MRVPSNTVPKSFYENPDVVEVSRQLLGKVLCAKIESTFTSGIITETEAYSGRNDKACHANNGKRTPRTEVMFGEPGHAYIYLCYGIHHLFNVVTNQKGLADAVLIRAIHPLHGLDAMKERRNMQKELTLTNGPGKFTKAMAITTSLNKTDLTNPPVWIEDHGIKILKKELLVTKRIGVDYAGSDADKPWRFQVLPNLFR
jgi:DNA-3-methyladenine glycosylase